jgi:histidine triad (HIT) family protein
MACIFCRIVAGEIPAKKVLETDAALAFEDLAPQAPTHVLVIPKRHVESVGGLGDEDAALSGKLLLAARDVARAKKLTDFRVVANSGAGAGQSVFHLHLHVLGGRPFDWPPG